MFLEVYPSKPAFYYTSKGLLGAKLQYGKLEEASDKEPRLCPYRVAAYLRLDWGSPIAHKSLHSKPPKLQQTMSILSKRSTSILDELTDSILVVLKCCILKLEYVLKVETQTRELHRLITLYKQAFEMRFCSKTVCIFNIQTKDDDKSALYPIFKNFSFFLDVFEGIFVLHALLPSSLLHYNWELSWRSNLISQSECFIILSRWSSRIHFPDKRPAN